ncbi:MAG: DUF4160 domain-containing protein [Lachnospiraceae bacterium]|nr:DUF4160 domain-containing protein [Lachnospiraceae bacterium]
MPVISRFYGITIKMYLRQKEHNPPHIHAIYGDCIGVFSILDGEMFEGDIPSKGQQMVKEFIGFYRQRLLEMWETQKFEPLSPIE